MSGKTRMGHHATIRNDDAAGHLRMHRAVVLVRSRLRERERILPIRVDRLRLELACRARNHVRNVVLVLPSHSRPALDLNRDRREHGCDSCY